MGTAGLFQGPATTAAGRVKNPSRATGWFKGPASTTAARLVQGPAHVPWLVEGSTGVAWLVRGSAAAWWGFQGPTTTTSPLGPDS